MYSFVQTINIILLPAYYLAQTATLGLAAFPRQNIEKLAAGAILRLRAGAQVLADLFQFFLIRDAACEQTAQSTKPQRRVRVGRAVGACCEGKYIGGDLLILRECAE